MSPAEQRECLDRIWTILVEDAGASNNHWDRLGFIENHLETKYPCTEWRFQGKLGFGGKFRRQNDKFTITCYREDETPERLVILDKVNEKLAQIPFWMPFWMP